MFNLGGAMKNITEKAEGLVEEKKHAAAALLEHQVKETGEFFARTMTEAEGKAVNAAEEAKRAAVDGFDKEVEKIGNAALQEKSTNGIDGDGLLGGVTHLIGSITGQIENSNGSPVNEVTNTVGEANSSMTNPIDKPTVSGIVNSLGNTASEMTDKIEGVARPEENKVENINGTILEAAGTTIKAKTPIQVIKNIAKEMANKVQETTSEIANEALEASQVMQNVAVEVKDKVQMSGGQVANKLQGVTSEITDKMQGAVHLAEDVAGHVANGVQGVVGEFANQIQSAPTETASVVQGITSELTTKQIPGAVHLTEGVPGHEPNEEQGLYREFTNQIKGVVGKVDNEMQHVAISSRSMVGGVLDIVGGVTGGMITSVMGNVTGGFFNAVTGIVASGMLNVAAGSVVGGVLNVVAGSAIGGTINTIVQRLGLSKLTVFTMTTVVPLAKNVIITALPLITFFATNIVPFTTNLVSIVVTIIIPFSTNMVAIIKTIIPLIAIILRTTGVVGNRS